ncbi:hypothetical protein ESCO_005858 [Escovopsis weberi]|uniref:Uncharacterized protein n=1 Tax=Escovopsis weberi TaxID=150374 RepID=A0A0M8MQB7_ESCWE|nr:hypothetical protein ESCO_005858 [Escovopsis weberi]
MALISTLFKRGSPPAKPLPFWLLIGGLLICVSAVGAFMLYDSFARPSRRSRTYSVNIPLRRRAAALESIPSAPWGSGSGSGSGYGYGSERTAWWAASDPPRPQRTLRRVVARVGRDAPAPVRHLPALPPAAPRLESLESLPSLGGAGRGATPSLVSIGVNSDAGSDAGDRAGYEGSLIEAEGLAEAARAVEDEVRGGARVTV